MSKLYFRYGAMGCGKTAQLLIVAHNYESLGLSVAVFKPKIDTRDETKIYTRIGLTRQVDALISSRDNLYKLITLNFPTVNCLLIDEAQFLTKQQINQLQQISVHCNITVIAYGIRCDSNQESWPGSRRLLEIAHTIEEIKTICKCGKKATINARFSGNNLQTTGPKILIDDDKSKITYKSLCPKCWYGELAKADQSSVESAEMQYNESKQGEAPYQKG